MKAIIVILALAAYAFLTWIFVKASDEIWQKNFLLVSYGALLGLVLGKL